MKKLEDYKGQKLAIHFPTYELWLRRKEINPSDDLSNENWNINKEKTVYYVDIFISGQYGGLGLAEKNGYNILPATDFLEDDFIYGQEYEFSDDEDFQNKTIALYGCKYPKESESNYNFIAFNKNGFMMPYTYARKINTERNEAITTIKELVSKFSINQNEVF